MRVLAAVLLFLLPLLHPASVHGTDEFDFDPHQFVRDAAQDPASLNFTIPDDLPVQDPSGLVQEAQSLSDAVKSLLQEMADYVAHFSNATGQEAVAVRAFQTQVAQLNYTLQLRQARLESLQTLATTLTTGMDVVRGQLSCMANSGCHPTPITTTIPPAPVFNCATPPVFTANGTKQTGSFGVPVRYDFSEAGCVFTLKAAQPTGLVFTITVTDLRADSGSSLTLKDSRNGTDIPLTALGQKVFPLRGNTITITAKGSQRFQLQYLTSGVCDNFDCLFGDCIGSAGDNKPKCNCDSCHSLDRNGKCSIVNPDPCATFGFLCSNSNPPGSCHKTLTCEYYCKCPGVPDNCTTLTFCGSGTDCPAARPLVADEKRSFWSRWFGL